MHTIREAVHKGNNSALREAAHSLKTASANLGANELSALCRELEDLGRHEKSETAQALLANLETAFQQVVDALSREMQKISDEK